MPLYTSSDLANSSSVANSDAEYLIFYSSIDSTNQMWCPDCRRVEASILKAFDSEDAPSALVVYVGQREDWKENENNPFRGSPWHVASVPTVLRRDGSRLVDDEIDEEALEALLNA